MDGLSMVNRLGKVLASDGDETSQWVGSNSFCTGCKITFANNPFNYYHREEQYITNPNDTIFLNYNASALSPNPNIVKNATSAHANMIATYELSYKKGKVIGLGIYSDVVINNRYFLVFLDHLLQAGYPLGTSLSLKNG
jgi:hypothetical protein